MLEIRTKRCIYVVFEFMITDFVVFLFHVYSALDAL